MSKDPYAAQGDRLLSRNVFIEGRDAYNDWIDKLRRGPMPINPYPAGFPDHDDWETGFDDAMEWNLHGQYQER